MISDKQLSQGNFLFRYRGVTPVPIIFICTIYLLINDVIISDEKYILCLIISLSGLIIRVLAVGYAYDKTSGKNTKKQIAEKLNTTGIYSILRNPLYLANYLNWLGIILLLSNTILTISVTLFFILIYYKIILVEENFLKNKFQEDVKIYFSKTNRILPSFSNYKRPINHFNIKKSLINIKNGLLGISILFFLIRLMDNYKLRKELIEINWIFYFLVFSIVFYIAMKLLYSLTKK